MSRLIAWLASVWAWWTVPRRQRGYAVVVAVGTVAAGYGLITADALNDYLGVFTAGVAALTLIVASIRARRGDIKAIYVALATVIVALRAAGIIDDGTAASWTGLLASLASVAGPLMALLRTDISTPTGEPAAEYAARHGATA